MRYRLSGGKRLPKKRERGGEKERHVKHRGEDDIYALGSVWEKKKISYCNPEKMIA